MALTPKEQAEIEAIIRDTNLKDIPVGNPTYPFASIDQLIEILVLGFAMQSLNAISEQKQRGIFFDIEAREWKVDPLNINLN